MGNDHRFIGLCETSRSIPIQSHISLHLQFAMAMRYDVLYLACGIWGYTRPFITIKYGTPGATARTQPTYHICNIYYIYAFNYMRIRFHNVRQNASNMHKLVIWVKYEVILLMEKILHHIENSVNNGINYRPQLVSRISSIKSMCVFFP